MSEEFERKMNACLKQQAEKIQVSEEWSRQVLNQVRFGAEDKEEISMKHKRIRALAICAAIGCLGMGSVFAAERASVSYTAGSSPSSPQIKSYEKLEAKLGAEKGAMKTVDAFSNGFSFAGAGYGDEKGIGEEGQTVYKVQVLIVDYQSGEKKVELSVKPHVEESTAAYTAAREENGIRFQYNCQDYKTVPADGGEHLTELDKKNVEEGKLVISYGGDEEEYMTHSCVSWTEDGMDYAISGIDLGLNAEVMFEMAREVAFGK